MKYFDLLGIDHSVKAAAGIPHQIIKVFALHEADEIIIGIDDTEIGCARNTKSARYLSYKSS